MPPPSKPVGRQEDHLDDVAGRQRLVGIALDGHPQLDVLARNGRLGADRRLGRQIAAGRFLDQRPDDGAGLGRAFGRAGALLVEDRLLADGDGGCARAARRGWRRRRRRSATGGSRRRCRRGAAVGAAGGAAAGGRIAGGALAAASGRRRGGRRGGCVRAATEVPSPTPAAPPAGPGSVSVPSGVRRCVNLPRLRRRCGRCRRPPPAGARRPRARGAGSARLRRRSRRCRRRSGRAGRRTRPCSARRRSRRRRAPPAPALRRASRHSRACAASPIALAARNRSILVVAVDGRPLVGRRRLRPAPALGGRSRAAVVATAWSSATLRPSAAGSARAPSAAGSSARRRRSPVRPADRTAALRRHNPFRSRRSLPRAPASGGRRRRRRRRVDRGQLAGNGRARLLVDALAHLRGRLAEPVQRLLQNRYEICHSLL